MINCAAIKQSVLNMEYGFNRPESSIVLVPIVSLIFRKYQISHLVHTLKTTYTTPDQASFLLNSHSYQKINTIHKWHIFGGAVQTIFLVFLVAVHPLFLLPAAISFYELCSSLKGLTQDHIHFKGQWHIHK